MLVTLRGYSVKFVNCLHLTANFWLFSGSRLTLLRPSVNVFFFFLCENISIIEIA